MSCLDLSSISSLIHFSKLLLFFCFKKKIANSDPFICAHTPAKPVLSSTTAAHTMLPNMLIWPLEVQTLKWRMQIKPPKTQLYINFY